MRHMIDRWADNWCFHFFTAAPAPPEIVRVDSGLNDLEIHWKVIVTDPKFPILNYLVQIKEKGESQKWINCTTTTTEANYMMCVMGMLKSNTEYVVRVSARNVAGNSEFTVREVSTKEEVQGNNRYILRLLTCQSV